MYNVMYKLIIVTVVVYVNHVLVPVHDIILYIAPVHVVVAPHVQCHYVRLRARAQDS